MFIRFVSGAEWNKRRIRSVAEGSRYPKYKPGPVPIVGLFKVYRDNSLKNYWKDNHVVYSYGLFVFLVYEYKKVQSVF